VPEVQPVVTMKHSASTKLHFVETALGLFGKQSEKLKTELDELIEPYSDDVAYHAFLKMERLARGL
jgi:hypothetical protein